MYNIITPYEMQNNIHSFKYNQTRLEAVLNVLN